MCNCVLDIIIYTRKWPLTFHNKNMIIQCFSYIKLVKCHDLRFRYLKLLLPHLFTVIRSSWLQSPRRELLSESEGRILYGGVPLIRSLPFPSVYSILCACAISTRGILSYKKEMYIRQIVIDGFKSYAQRTEIGPFDSQFNAITGLNGSGKSNILDSVCFLLGISNLSQVCLVLYIDLYLYIYIPTYYVYKGLAIDDVYTSFYNYTEV